MSKVMRKIAVLLALVMCISTVDAGFVNVYAESNPESKKGIQGYGYMFDETEDWKELGVNHVLINLDISKCIYTGDDGYPVPYKGTNYYYTWTVNQYIDAIKMLNEQGISVTCVLLMGWSDDSEINKLIYPGGRKSGHSFYAWNVYDTACRNQLEALFAFLLETYSKSNCHIDNWIIGNEVNMPKAYNYTGTTDTATNVDICAESFLLFYNVMQQYNPDAKAYISLDHSWTHNDEGRGIAGKSFLNKFYESINKKQSGVKWNIAYHPYPAIMDATSHPHADTLLWGGNRYTPNNSNADFVSTANLTVLTDYVKENFGSDVRIILSELGYDCSYSQTDQAAATAFAYYAGQFNDMVDAMMFRNYLDDANDGTFKFGFKNSDYSKRPSFNVFKYMDTEYASTYADPYLSTVGINSWKEWFPNYDYNVLCAQPEVEYVGDVNTELQSFTYNEDTKYLSGQIVVVEWVDGVSTVPKYAPKMTFDATDGSESIEVFVTPTGTNTYYFDRLVSGGLTPGKEYIFNVTSSNPLNIGTNKTVPVYTGTSTIGTEGTLGSVKTQNIKFKTNYEGKLIVYGEKFDYYGHVNSLLKSVDYVSSDNGDFISGNIIITEWIDGVSVVPETTPVMTFESYDGAEVNEVFMACLDGTNTYYFDRNLSEEMDVTKDYIFRITLTEDNNISPYKSMVATTNEMSAKEGILWETDTQVVMYKTVAADGDNQLRVYAVNK